jgi:hypothetical protein
MASQIPDYVFKLSDDPKKVEAERKKLTTLLGNVFVSVF